MKMSLNRIIPFVDGPRDLGRTIAAGLLQIGAVELRTNDVFTWSSGWKSPIYCDNRLILGYPVLRNLVIDGYESIVKTDFPSVDLVVGTATGGIAPAAFLAERLGLPMAYVRSGAKEHGQQKRAEGRIAPGARAIVVEDTLSTGKSSYQAVQVIQEEGLHVMAVFTVLSYDFQIAQERAKLAQVPAYRLVPFQELIDVALHRGYVSEQDMSMLMAWRESPETFAQSIKSP